MVTLSFYSCSLYFYYLIFIIYLAFSNNLTDVIDTLIKGESKLNTLNSPDERFVSTYSLISAFNSSFAFKDSFILTQNERISLTQILNFTKEMKLILTYRASRDGFGSSDFHSKCDYISNTVTIIKTTSNSVFGGFTSAPWTSSTEYTGTYDPNAFLFSLRQLGNTNKQRLNITSPNYAILINYSYGPSFGAGYDLYVSDNSNQNENSYSNLGGSYKLPNKINRGTLAQSYLAGSYHWKTTEIEVYQVTPFLTYSVSFLHNGCIFLL